MITGIYVGIENPSWIAASMALANMVEDKVTFCKRYGIDITEDQWPCKYIPQTILADNGEFKWLMPESLPENLNITIENTSSGRADMKPNVERAFGVVRSHFEFLLDGVIKKKLRDRGEKDERIEATIDVYQFTQIVINIVLFMNNNRWIESYDLNEEMIEDFVKLIPIELWNYGIENSSGKLMSVQEDIFKYNLLPKDTVTIRRDGVRLFKVLYYYFENPQYNDMIIRAGISGSKKIEVGYDKRDMSYISIYNNETRSLERAALLGKSKMFEGMSYDEVKAVIDNYNLERSDYMHEQTQANILLNKKNSKILDEGRMMTKQAMDGYNKKAKVKNMKEHRRTEKENVRNEESFELAKKDDNSTKKIQKPERNLAEEYYSKGDMEKLLNDIMGE
jgi:Mu transposase, C-terminal.